MNLPNKLTIMRMCAIPLIIVVALIKSLQEIVIFKSITLDLLILLIIFALASFTDFLDGKIARKYNLITNFGKFMDPLADKLLVMSTLIVLLEKGMFSAFGIGFGFAIIVILAREFAVTGLRTIAADNNKVIAASKLGKLKTVSQMVMIIFMLVDCYPFRFISELAGDIACLVLILVATLLTIVSGIDYFVKNKHVLKESK